MSDLTDRLRASDGFAAFRATDGSMAFRVDTDILREAADEIERLRGWKAEAMFVLGEWDTVFHMIGSDTQRIGQSKWAVVADEIKRLRTIIERAKDA